MNLSIIYLIWYIFWLPNSSRQATSCVAQRSFSSQVHEYVKVLDQSSGTIRVESGTKGSSKQVYLGPHDKVLDNGKKKAA